MTDPIEPPETVHVTETLVSCDGNGGALGHPKIYLSLGDDGRVECPYCDRLFVLDAAADKTGGGH